MLKRQLLSKGVGALVKHHTAFTQAEEETKSGKSQSVVSLLYQALQNQAVFFYIGKLVPLQSPLEERTQRNTVIFRDHSPFVILMAPSEYGTIYRRMNGRD